MLKRLIQPQHVWAKATESGASLGSAKPGDIGDEIQFPEEGGGGGGGEVKHAVQGDSDLRGGGGLDPKKVRQSGQEGSDGGASGGSQTGATSTGGATGPRQ